MRRFKSTGYVDNTDVQTRLLVDIRELLYILAKWPDYKQLAEDQLYYFEERRMEKIEESHDSGGA